MFSKTYRDVNPLLRCKLSEFTKQLCSKLPEATIEKACSWADVCCKEKSFDDSQSSLGEMSSYVEGPASLNDALSKGLSPSSDWSAKVAAFTYLRSLLQQGPKGIQEVVQNFEKVRKLFFQHLDYLHHKVAQVALSTLVDIIPSYRKPFESYMERIFSHVFSRERKFGSRLRIASIFLNNKHFPGNPIPLHGLPHSYGVKAQGVDNNKDAIGLVASGAKFGLMI
ncbi:hypothetical protein GOBAR_DD15275 [Gossypium barbadense]|nr:hypothetical protein GOBAR_DD15275 [Gossypium barbadense]